MQRPSADADQADAFSGIKDDLVGLGQYDEAVAAARKALELATKQHGENSWRLVMWLAGFPAGLRLLRRFAR